MSARTRSLTALAAGLMLLGTAACSGGAGGGTNKPVDPKAGIRAFDTCALFTPQDLKAAGVHGPGKHEEQVSFEPGCSYEGEKMDLTLYKNQKETVDKYATDGSWDQYQKFNINGRKAARAIGSGGAGQGACSIVVDAGGGVVLVAVAGAMRDSLPDPCGTAENIARQIEPRLPK